MGQVAGGLNIGIGRGRFWDWAVVQEEMDPFGYLFRASFWNTNSVELVVLRGAANVPAVKPMRGPGLEIGGRFKNENLDSLRGEGDTIKIEDPIDLGFR